MSGQYGLTLNEKRWVTLPSYILAFMRWCSSCIVSTSHGEYMVSPRSCSALSGLDIQYRKSQWSESGEHARMNVLRKIRWANLNRGDKLYRMSLVAAQSGKPNYNKGVHSDPPQVLCRNTVCLMEVVP